MAIWEVDFYRRPLQDEAGSALWELAVCEPQSGACHALFCTQAEANTEWLIQQLRHLTDRGLPPPTTLRSFRPQSLNLLKVASQTMGIAIEPTRQTPTLKQYLQARSRTYPTLPNYTRQPYDPLALDQPPPLPLAENLWGEQWRFATLPAGELVEALSGRMIPIFSLPEEYLPLKLGLASTTVIPGIVIDAGRKSMSLASWLQQSHPVALNYVAGAPDGLVLEAGLVDRWIVATFDDPDVANAARSYEQRKQASRGLHFLLVQPDDSGMTYSGFWLLKPE